VLQQIGTKQHIVLKFAADQGFAVAQGGGIDFKGAAHDFEVAADQAIAAPQNLYENCLKGSEGIRRSETSLETCF
jgi:hypothetical protein